MSIIDYLRNHKNPLIKTYRELGSINFNKTLYTKAINYYLKSDTLNETDFMNLALSYELTGKKEKAIECYESILKNDHRYSNYNLEKTYMQLLYLYFDKKSYEKVIECYQRLDPAELQEEAKILQDNSVYYIAGKSFQELNHIGAAIETYKKAVFSKSEVFINTDKIYIELGNCLLTEKKKKQALDYFNKSLSINFNSKLSEYIKKIQ